MSELFEGRKPKWPTLKSNAKLPTQETFEVGNVVFYSFDSHIERETETGGLFGGTIPVEYPMVSFEVRKFVRRMSDERRTALYYICWASEYRHGVIMHIGPQYPHLYEFYADDVERAAVEVYGWFAEAAYAAVSKEVDVRVRKFLDKAKQLHD